MIRTNSGDGMAHNAKERVGHTDASPVRSRSLPPGVGRSGDGKTSPRRKKKKNGANGGPAEGEEAIHVRRPAVPHNRGTHRRIPSMATRSPGQQRPERSESMAGASPFLSDQHDNNHVNGSMEGPLNGHGDDEFLQGPFDDHTPSLTSQFSLKTTSMADVVLQRHTIHKLFRGKFGSQVSVYNDEKVASHLQNLTPPGAEALPAHVLAKNDIKGANTPDVIIPVYQTLLIKQLIDGKGGLVHKNLCHCGNVTVHAKFLCSFLSPFARGYRLTLMI